MSAWKRVEGSSTVDWLKSQIARGEVAHAWLLIGPAGSGKHPVATSMAAALNCEAEPGRGCGACSTCLRTLRYRHPDVHHIVPEGPLIPVDTVREFIIPEASRSPFEGRRKVFVIDEADRMNEPAQNALLKTLEEPQEDTVFILLTSKEEDLLDTILSRCRIVRLEPVPEDRIVELLRAEGSSDTQALLAARLSDGDPARARHIALDADFAGRRGLWLGIPRRLTSPLDALDAAAEIVAEAKAVVKEREAVQKDEVKELAEAMGEGRGTATARGALAKRHKRELRRLEEETLGDALQTMASFYRDALVLRKGGTETVANLDHLEELQLWADAEIPDAAFVRVMERCVETRAALPRNANAVLALEACLLELTRLAPPQTRVHAW